jgi:hypothetical protein
MPAVIPASDISKYTSYVRYVPRSGPCGGAIECDLLRHILSNLLQQLPWAVRFSSQPAARAFLFLPLNAYDVTAIMER